MNLFIFATVTLIINVILTTGLLYKASYKEEDIIMTAITYTMIQILIFSYVTALHTGEFTYNITNYYTNNLEYFIYQSVNYIYILSLISFTVISLLYSITYQDITSTIRINYPLWIYIFLVTSANQLLILNFIYLK